MNGRRVVFLLVAAVVIFALAAWLSTNRQTAAPTLAGKPVLPGLSAAVNSIGEVRLSKGDGTKATLKKGATDWMVAEKDYPADSGKVRKLLLDLGSLNVVEEKTRVAANFPQLGVEDTNAPKATGTRVDAVAGGKTYSVIIGKPGPGKSGYVRAVGSQLSVQGSPLVSADADPRHWLDNKVVDIPQERIKDFAVKPATGSAYNAARDKKETPDFTVTPLPKGRELSSPAVADPIAGSLATLTLEDVQHAAADAGAKLSHTIFHTFDGLEVDVAGRKDGNRSLITIAARSTDKATQAEAQTLTEHLKGWEFEIPGYRYDGMFRTIEDLLKPLPAPPGKAGAKAGKGTAPPAELPGAPDGGVQIPLPQH
jgi:hypothetical protein